MQTPVAEPAALSRQGFQARAQHTVIASSPISINLRCEPNQRARAAIAMSHEVSITDLSARVVKAARASHARIITVESCTAGSLCTLLADTPGAGDVLLGGLVTYAKTCKSDVLGIPQEIISSHSAVSAHGKGRFVKV